MRKLALVCGLLAISIPGLLVSAQVSRAVIDRAGMSTVFVETDQASGSGFLFSSDGYVLTCNHVIDEATTIEVYIPDGRKFSGRVVQAAPEIDAAVLKIDATVQAYLSLGDSASASYGDAVAAIGYPQRVFTVTTGTVSAFPTFGNMKIMQVTAPINPGNSGGPLVRYSGEVIGIIFAAADADEYLKEYGFVPQGMNYAIPIDAVKERFALAATLLLEDDFSQLKGWERRSDVGGVVGLWEDPILGKSLHIIKQNDGWNQATRVPVSPAPQSFILEVSARSLSSSAEHIEGYGVSFRVSYSPAKGWSYYTWFLHTDGSFEVWKCIDNQCSIPLARAYTSAMRLHREVNRLRLTVQETGFRFEINGLTVATLTDGSITPGGDIHIYAAGGSADNDFPYAHVAFASLRLYELH